MKKIIVIAALLLAGCCHDPRVDDLVRHQKYIDKQIDYLSNTQLDKDDAHWLIESSRSGESIEKNTDEIIRQVHCWYCW